MDELLKELKKIFSFKADTRIGDIVLIVAEKPQAILYALVSDIVRDESKVNEWWQVCLHLLVLPPQKIVWVLREPQFTGKEIFTMGGERRFVQALNFVDHSDPVGKKKNAGLKKSSLRLIK
jgi:hypothetical protein